jgi:thioredoxin-like negative regulator of GroEL
MTGHENFKTFTPFRRDLKTPCVLFAKWDSCPHCHNMVPHMKAVQARLRGSMPVYIVDAEKQNKVCEQLRVGGFPTIMVLRKDRIVKKYNGPHDSQKILAFVKSASS